MRRPSVRSGCSVFLYLFVRSADHCVLSVDCKPHNFIITLYLSTVGDMCCHSINHYSHVRNI